MIAGHQPFQQMGELKMLHNNATHPFPEAKKQYIAALLKSFHCNHLEMNGNFYPLGLFSSATAKILTWSFVGESVIR